MHCCAKIIVVERIKIGGNKMVERRKSKRTDIDAVIALKQLGDNFVTGISGKAVSVNTLNISKDGIAFKSDRKFKLNSYHDTIIKLDNKESFEAIIEVVRMENRGEPETTYGCRFIGITSDDQFKIDVYQIVYESRLATEGA